VSPVGAGRILRGAWSRRDLNVGLGLVVAVATAAAVAAPTFAGAAVSGLVRERAAAADPADTDLSWAMVVADPARDLPATVDAATGFTGGTDGTFEQPVVRAVALAEWREIDDVPVSLTWQADLCERVQVTGRCPTRPGEVLLPAGSVARSHPTGDQIVVVQSPEDDGPVRTLRLTVVGTWSPEATGDVSGYDGQRWTPGGIVPTYFDCEGTPRGELTTTHVGSLLTDLSTLRLLPDVTVLADAALVASTDVERMRTAADDADDWQDGRARPIEGTDSCAAAVSVTDIDGVVGPIDDERSQLQRQGVGAAAGAVLVGCSSVRRPGFPSDGPWPRSPAGPGSAPTSRRLSRRRSGRWWSSWPPWRCWVS
jgi:putative ABC transport system permease protein